MPILDQFTFKGRQEQAVRSTSPAIAVTAGAGSGKTRVLTGRYLHLLEQGSMGQGHPLRSLIAITFTEKAAREMRTRIRGELERWAANPAGPAPVNERLTTALTELDAARIGTIHSLCAELLRAHPAEAGLDPAFNVLEEGLAAALRTEAIENILAWAAGEAAVVPLFAHFKENELRRLLTDLLNRRLDLEGWLASSASDPLPNWSAALAAWLDEHLNAPAWQEPLADLAGLKASDSNDKLELARGAVLAHWQSAQAHLQAAEWDAAFETLARLRKATSTTGGSKSGWLLADLDSARQAMRALNQYYDGQLKPLVGKSLWALDEQAAALLPALRQLIQQAFEAYARRKDEQQALDFDDLEGRAARLLAEHPAVCALWQNKIHAVLVDEFQDTNQRQRQIVYALSNFSPANAFNDESAHQGIFIVGDAKQSIYKFRGADVTVFRQVQADIAAAGGQAVDLDLTFRAHQPLLDLLNPLLSAILGDGTATGRPYDVPFAPLSADRPAPKTARPPYLEFHTGCGEDAEEGRTAATAALAQRLCRLHNEEKFAWGDIALLFRASTAFEAYEDALERAGIPFVTVAGRGFYNRPEIRDLLNLLAAIADPTDDLALAGALRSPALALPDDNLYHLRFPAGQEEGQPLWPALQSSPVSLHQQASAILGELHALSGRAPAAEVLKRLLDLTGLRAILGAAPGGGRMLRNVDKLLADAHRSQLVGLGEFLEYIQTLRNVGLREGEAPVEAGGAVQLMTVHKSKGLEFPVVVICDAAHEQRQHTAGAQFIPELGLLPGLKNERGELRPAAWLLAALEDDAREQAEDRRLLYVAATRAKEKLLISGHIRLGKTGKLGLRGWLGDLGKALGVDEMPVSGPMIQSQELLAGEGISWMLHPPASQPEVSPFVPPSPMSAGAAPGDLIASLITLASEAVDERTQARESDPPQRVWRVVPKAKRPSGPAWLVGQLVHEALRHWQFPAQGDEDDPRWEAFLRPYALEAGLAGEAEIHATLREVRRMLERFRAHPLCAEIEASERYHELPYIFTETSQSVDAAHPAYQRGVLDLLYRLNTASPWVIVDFKTDEVKSEASAHRLIQQAGYDRQVRRYVDAVQVWLGCCPQTRLVFLHVADQVVVFDIC